MEDRLSAAQSIWWLASIIQFTEILVYNRQYKIFSSDYIIICKVKPLPSILPGGSLIPESDIPAMDINIDADCQANSSQWKLPPKARNAKQAKLNTTCCGKVFKNTRYPQPSIQQLHARFRNQCKQQWRRTCEPLRNGEFNIERDYT